MLKNQNGELRSGWKIAFFTLAMFAIILAVSMVMFLFVIFILMTQGKLHLNSLYDINSDFYQQMSTYGMYVQEIIMIIAPIFTWRIILKKPLSSMGLSGFIKNKTDFLSGLLFGIISITIVFLVIIASNQAEVVSWQPRFSPDLLTGLILFIFVGFAEEIYGRGFVISTLRQTRRYPVMILVSSVLFSLMHSMNSGVGVLPYLNLFIAGMLFAYMYIKSGTLWMCIGYHITWNYFQGNIYGFNVSGIATKSIFTTVYQNDNLINGGKFGPEGGLIVTVILLLGFLFTKYYYRNKLIDFMALEQS